MAEERGQVDNIGRQDGRPGRVLRAVDIIPSRGPDSTAQQQQTVSNIPAFDLGQQILAEQRRAVATKRKAPPAALQAPPRSEGATGRTVRRSVAPPYDPVIAQIVARDIELATAGLGGYSQYIR